MLAEKFFLVLETLRSHASDGSVKVTSAARHIPASMPSSQNKSHVGASNAASVCNSDG